MQRSKTKLYGLNALLSATTRIVMALLQFFVTRAFLQSYGSEVNGLLSSVSQAINYICLAEAGLTAASMQALYKPLAEEDFSKISQILVSTRRSFYNVTKIFGIGIIGLSLLYPLFLKSSTPYPQIAALILAQSLSGILSFSQIIWRNTLLQADQRIYVSTFFNFSTSTALMLLKLFLISRGTDFVLVQLTHVLEAIATSLLLSWYIKRNYPLLDMTVTGDDSALSQRSSVMVHQLSNIAVNTKNVILTSMFVGLRETSLYAVYALVFDNLQNTLYTIAKAAQPGFGHIYSKGDERKTREVYEDFYGVAIPLVMAVQSTSLFLITAFIRLYTAKITDFNYRDYWLPLLISFSGLIIFLRFPGDIFCEVGGLFRETRRFAIIDALINMSFSLLLLPFLGIYGLLIGSVIAGLYRLFVNTRFVEKKLSGTRIITLKASLAMAIYFIPVVVIYQFAFNWSPSWFKLIAMGFICFPSTFIISLLLFLFFFPESVKRNLRRLQSLLRIKRIV